MFCRLFIESKRLKISSSFETGQLKHSQHMQDIYKHTELSTDSTYLTLTKSSYTHYHSVMAIHYTDIPTVFHHFSYSDHFVLFCSVRFLPLSPWLLEKSGTEWKKKLSLASPFVPSVSTNFIIPCKTLVHRQDWSF